MAMAEHATSNGAASREDISVSVEVVESGETAADAPPPAIKGDAFVVVDLGCCDGRADDGGSDKDAEMCRICHMNTFSGEEGSEMIQLGCGCKAELGGAHRYCAETWFRVKGDRCCEICGATAKNITAEVEARQAEGEDHGGELGTQNARENGERVVVWWRSQPFCNFLMASMIVAFMLLWFFRVDIF